MTTFSVQTDELRRLAANLATFHSQLGHVTNGLSGLGEAQTGHPGLASAVSGFVDHWHYALGKIDEHAKAVEDRLKQAAEIYTAADDGIAHAAGG
jgi:Excreted virulence factor EspC, type VII ESX diderm